jgi:serine protease Do
MIQDLTPSLAKAFGLGARTGILVGDVNAGTPAAAAGVHRGDIILKLDGKPIKEIGPFRNRIAMMAPGSSVDLTVLRDGREQSLTVTIGKLPAQAVSATGTPEAAPQAAMKLGLQVEDLTPDRAQQSGHAGESGVLVAEVAPGSPAALAGIHPGSVIQEVNRQAVRNVGEFRHAIDRAMKTGTILLLVREDDASRYVALSLDDQG